MLVGRREKLRRLTTLVRIDRLEHRRRRLAAVQAVAQVGVILRLRGWGPDGCEGGRR